MNLLRSIFSTKQETQAVKQEAQAVVRAEQVQATSSRPGEISVGDAWRYQQIMSMLDGLVHPSVVGNNFIEMFKTIPGVLAHQLHSEARL